MKKIYILPNIKVIELPEGDLCMLTGSTGDETPTSILTGGGEGNGTDIAARENNSLWDNEW